MLGPRDSRRGTCPRRALQGTRRAQHGPVGSGPGRGVRSRFTQRISCLAPPVTRASSITLLHSWGPPSEAQQGGCGQELAPGLRV